MNTATIFSRRFVSSGVNFNTIRNNSRLARSDLSQVTIRIVALVDPVLASLCDQVDLCVAAMGSASAPEHRSRSNPSTARASGRHSHPGVA
jgi:hypothetical protein